ncbi:MAG: heavy-metal-associated domain-containing protein [Desulfobacteraceae bacterium]|nr:heavy-metal-associated domain-containing protein [Desulfobacteraceae bacterium]
MENKTFSIPNISCGHCVAAIKTELSELSGVKKVDGKPEDKTITVEWEIPASEAQLLAKLEEINYPAE